MPTNTPVHAQHSSQEQWRQARHALETSLGSEHVGAYFVRTLKERLGETNEALLLLGLLTLLQVDSGHSCMDLGQVKVSTLLQNLEVQGGDGWLKVPECSIQEWSTLFESSAIVGDSGCDRPFIFDGQRLYLRRFYQAQSLVAASIARKIRQSGEKPLFGPPDAQQRAHWLAPLFETPLDEGDLDMQCIAACTALESYLSVITGGPGTGKTYTVVRLIALWLQAALAAGVEPAPRILLLAPTGKAAGRLAESVVAAKAKLRIDAEVSALIPEQALTIHRALGLTGQGPPRRNRLSPLACDLVVVDELSMIDLELMAQLMDAIEDRTSCVFLGDAKQLTSVGAGSVLSEICGDIGQWMPAKDWRNYLLSTLSVPGDASVKPRGAAVEERAQREVQRRDQGQDATLEPANQSKAGRRPKPGLRDITVHLHKSRRYDPNSGLAHFAKAILAADFRRCKELLQDGARSDIQWLKPGAQRNRNEDKNPSLSGELFALCKAQYQSLLRAQNPEDAMHAQEQFRILCATRHGKSGVETINRVLAGRFAYEQRQLYPSTADPRWFPGASIMIRKNDPSTALFNGDLGVVLAAPQQSSGQATPIANSLRAYFPAVQQDARSFVKSRLPEFEWAFAMSIHKSQGSEFRKVLVILPPPPSPLLTRELLYTAITRARDQLWLVASESALDYALEHHATRHSGLGDAIAKQQAAGVEPETCSG